MGFKGTLVKIHFTVLIVYKLQIGFSNSQSNLKDIRWVISQIKSSQFFAIKTKLLLCFCLNFECWKENSRFGHKMNIIDANNCFKMKSEDRKWAWKRTFIGIELLLTNTWHDSRLHNKELWALCLAYMYNSLTDTF